MKRIITFIIFIVVSLFIKSEAENVYKRARGEGMLSCESANTLGSKDIWVDVESTGFLWDSDPSNNNMPGIYAFPKIKVSVGLFGRFNFTGESRILSYGYKPGWVVGSIKYCLLNNKNIRLHQYGIMLKGNYSLLKKITSSIAGYRDDTGMGFSPEGFLFGNTSVSVYGLWDIDCISISSYLPFRLSNNVGIRLPASIELLEYSQYLYNFGFSYIGYDFDVFCEYSIEAFVNKSVSPKRFDFSWPGFNGRHKIWEVAFLENPMYITVGGRIRYSSGASLLAAVPMLLSTNVGSAMTPQDKVGLDQGKFPDETNRGITDPFDPWYAKWKVVLQISYPIAYHQTSTELIRNYLLLKNKKKDIRLDVDRQLIESDERKEKEGNDNKKERLEKIKKMRQDLEQSDQ